MPNRIKTVARRSLFALLLAFTAMLGGGWAESPTAEAVAGINQRINFQGRLLTAEGATVPDGYYNLQFRVYQDGDGQTAGNATGSPAGSLEWTESYLNANGNGVMVRNGYLSVELGSVTPFGSSIDWNQDTLWLSVNVGSTNGSCTPFSSCSPDGEMLPMRRFSSTPYALNAGMLGGRDASGFIQNSTSVQGASFNISGSGQATTLQGNTSILAPLLDTTTSGGTLNIGTVDASTINIATNNANHTVNVATGTGTQTVTLGSTSGASGTTVQGGSAGVNIVSGSGINLHINGPAYSALAISSSESAFNLQANSSFRVNDGPAGDAIISASNNGGKSFRVAYNATTYIDGDANFARGINIQGSGVTSQYTTPLGTALSSAINVSNYNVGNFSQVLAMGLPAGSSSTARGILVADARTGAHQATIGILSPDENQVFGLSFNGSNTTAYLESTGNTIALQGGGQQLLTVTKNGSAANVGIGNNATSGYALDVTGDINSSTQYRIGGTTTLTNSALTFSAASASSVIGANNQQLTVQGGNATTLNANGGNLILSGGTGNGTGSNGLVVLSTPTFSTTANDANCYTGGALVASTCTITQASVNNSSAVIIGFSTTGQTATMPDPTILTAGRVVYVTAANGSSDFTLSVNGGGTGNQIAMRQNTTATMIWNGADWTAAGASSSTTLQSAYDNTLQSAGGAELVVSKTSTTNGFTIRDSSTNPVNGTLLSVQTASAASLISVNGTVTEYASNAGAETRGGSDSTFPANTWTNSGTATVTRQNVAGSYIATGQGSVAIAATGANGGAKNILSSALSANTTYNVSFTTRLTAGSTTFTDMNVQYSADGGTSLLTQCSAAATSNTSVWTKVNCTFTTPASGITAANGILIRQTGSATRTFFVDNLSVTIAADYNFATDSTVSDSVNFGTNWVTAGQGTVSVTRNTADGNDASDSASANITAGAANAGVRNRLSSNPLPNTLYRLTAYVKSSNTFNDFKMRYSYNGSTNTTASNYVDCVDYNTQSISTSSWTKVTCYITTSANAPTNPYVYFVETTSTTRTILVDTFSMTLASSSTPNVQIGGGVNGGPTTLLTLDKGASAPIASDNDALLGSMYYDTTLGKLQCYEADGWGACGSSPDNVVTLSPEYTNAVLHGPSGGTAGIGTMTSDLCSDYLNINDGSSSQPTICGTNESFNFYKWTSPQALSQTYGIYVTYQLPSTFKSFNSGQTSLMGRTDNGSSGGSSNVSYKIFRNGPSGMTPCGSAVAVSSGTVTSWQTGRASGTADPSTCGFMPGDSIVFEIDVTTNLNANAYVGNLNFSFNNR